MSIESHEDPWLSPNRQAEFPTRAVLSAVKLHRRREKTFLLLAAIVMLATVALPLFGTSVRIDLAHFVATLVPDVTLPRAELAFGVFLLPLGMFAISLVAELYGRRRAYAMAVVGLLTSLSAVGLAHLRDTVAGVGDDLGPALALSIAAFFGHLVIVPVHCNMRRNSPTRRVWARKLAATLVAHLAAWTVFAFALYAQAVQMYGHAEDAVIAEIGALVIGGASFMLAVAIVDIIPFVAVAKALSIYLRVGQFESDEDDDSIAERSGSGWGRSAPMRTTPGTPIVRTTGTPIVRKAPEPHPLPAAQIVDTPPPPIRARPTKRTSMQPFSSAEMRFFTEGEEMAEGASEPTDGSIASSRAARN